MHFKADILGIYTKALVYIYIHELVVGAGQLASVAQLFRGLHQNCRATGSAPARDLKLHFLLLFLV